MRLFAFVAAIAFYFPLNHFQGFIVAVGFVGTLVVVYRSWSDRGVVTTAGVIVVIAERSVKVNSGRFGEPHG